MGRSLTSNIFGPFSSNPFTFLDWDWDTSNLSVDAFINVLRNRGNGKTFGWHCTSRQHREMKKKTRKMWKLISSTLPLLKYKPNNRFVVAERWTNLTEEFVCYVCVYFVREHLHLLNQQKRNLAAKATKVTRENWKWIVANGCVYLHI